MSDWLIILLFILAIEIVICTILGILLLIDYLQWKFKEKKSRLSASSKDNDKYCRHYPVLEDSSHLREADLESTIDSIMKHDITINDLKSFNGSIHGEFEDWHIPGLIQKDE